MATWTTVITHEGYTITVMFEPAEEGGYIVTCQELPELITQGDTFEEAEEMAKDALLAVVELYEDIGKELPSEIFRG